jgi:FixJ family two-component response regulator
MGDGKLLVAIVDDEDSVRRSVGRLLRSAGMEVETFASGRDFLRALHDSRPDFLVLDLHMPAMSGFDVCEELARTGIRVPVAIITGHDKPEYRARAIASGVTAYLPKPIDDKELIGAIAAAAAPSGDVKVAR